MPGSSGEKSRLTLAVDQRPGLKCSDPSSSRRPLPSSCSYGRDFDTVLLSGYGIDGIGELAMAINHVVALGSRSVSDGSMAVAAISFKRKRRGLTTLCGGLKFVYLLWRGWFQTLEL